MDRLDENLIAEALLAAPEWARIGLTAPVEHLRQQSARELALAIFERADRGPDPGPDQLALTL
jgi:hypothetical protein